MPEMIGIEELMKENDERESPEDEADGPKGQDETAEHEAPAFDAEADGDDGPNPQIKPVERKIGEGRDNLRQRAGWFRRRTGAGK
jgi:hypothetical protein